MMKTKEELPTSGPFFLAEWKTDNELEKARAAEQLTVNMCIWLDVFLLTTHAGQGSPGPHIDPPINLE
eukprot:143280-Pelagomonas_calceolata.AAC.2